MQCRVAVYVSHVDIDACLSRKERFESFNLSFQDGKR